MATFDAVHVHNLVNHFPIVLGAVGSAAAVLAVLVRRPGVWTFAGVTMLIAGATAPVAYWSGLQAEEVAEGLWYIDPGPMGEHEELAVGALVTLLAAGVAAALALKWPKAPVRALFVVLSLAATAATAAAAFEGGKIVHQSPLLEQE